MQFPILDDNPADRGLGVQKLKEAFGEAQEESLRHALAESQQRQAEVSALLQAARAVAGGTPLTEALFQVARHIGNESLRQLAIIFWHQVPPSDTLQGLGFLEDLLNRRQLLHGEADGDLMALKLTARVLQGFCLLTVGLVLAVPWWFDFYTSTLSRQGLFIELGTLALLVSLYFDRQLLTLEERIV